MELYDGSLNIPLTVFLISEKDTELRQARQHQLNFIRFKQFQILFAISTCTPKAVPYTSLLQFKKHVEIWNENKGTENLIFNYFHIISGFLL